MAKRLDSYGKFPSGMEDYLETYGWHFSKKMYDWAVSMLKKINQTTGKPELVDFYNKDQIDELLKKNSITLKNKIGYDYYYITNYIKAKYHKTSVDDEVHLAKMVRDYIDGDYQEAPFTRFYADCIGQGIPIIWEDML